jgi:hypothetical protein
MDGQFLDAGNIWHKTQHEDHQNKQLNTEHYKDEGVFGGENEMLMRGCLEGRMRCW